MTDSRVLIPIVNPLDLPQGAGSLISSAVNKFASNISCNYTLWQSGEPHWLVWKQDGGVVRQVQISAFDDLKGKVLRFIPSWKRINSKTGVVTLPREVGPDLIRELELRPALDSDKLFREMYGTLNEVWEIAKKMDTNALAILEVPFAPFR